jgi:hypothetical protein
MIAILLWGDGVDDFQIRVNVSTNLLGLFRIIAAAVAAIRRN